MELDNIFDEQWYLSRYPQARAALNSGEVSSAEEHYERIGRRYGFLRHVGAPRFEGNPSLYHEGFWTDGPGALDELYARVKGGLIPECVGPFIEQFINDGYCIIPSALPDDVVDNASQALEDIYDGKIPGIDYRWSGGRSWSEGIKENAAKAHDTHMMSEGILHAVLHKNITDILKLIFESDILASQSLAFYLGSAQRIHQDTAYVTYSQPRKFVGVWTALEDVEEGAGELLYVPGSHKVKPQLFADKYYSVHEALDAKAVQGHRNHNVDFLNRMDRANAEAGLSVKKFLAEKGDVLIWSALLTHGGAKTTRERTRKSVVTHFCPQTSAPRYFERKFRDVEVYSDGVHYSNFAY